MSEPSTKASERYALRKRRSKTTAWRARSKAVRQLSRANVGFDEYVSIYSRATPIEIVEVERHGIPGTFIKVLSKRMELPASRIFTILGIPRATAEKKAATGDSLVGSGGHAAFGMVKLLAIVRDLIANSTATEAKDFAAARWLGKWIERPQPSLGGRKPADMLDTPTGIDIVARLLRSVESGSYQ